MDRKGDLISFSSYGWHKGFYTVDDVDDITDALLRIRYTDFFEYPEDDEFPYDSAHSLLCGSCNHFAVALKNVLGYTPYIIEETDKKGFHAFCQVYKNGKITSGSGWIVPAELYGKIAQDAVLLKQGKNQDAAKEFLKFLQGPEAAKVKLDYGYGDK